MTNAIHKQHPIGSGFTPASTAELDRQISTSALLRSGTKKKVSSAMAQIQPAALDELTDAYSLEFLSLPDGHSEDDLHSSLLRNLGRFITELGRDFCFVGSEYPVQVGNQDFAIDLVFFHRGLSCLVAFELKVRRFEPADLGQLSFYVEALDRDVKKPHERPSIGVLLCATKDDEVVDMTQPQAGLMQTVSNSPQPMPKSSGMNDGGGGLQPPPPPPPAGCGGTAKALGREEPLEQIAPSLRC